MRDIWNSLPNYPSSLFINFAFNDFSKEFKVVLFVTLGLQMHWKKLKSKKKLKWR